jgi:uncharacterized protein YjbJ (UPF0337 family)
MPAPAAAMPFAAPVDLCVMWGIVPVKQRGNRAGNPGPAVALTRQKATRTFKTEHEMNWDRIEGNWKQFAGKVKEKWGKLSDDDLQTINGQQEQLIGRIQERYGVAKEEAQKQVKTWVGGL